MKMWNSEQTKAINMRNTNILVSASAGSGKTGVLVQRLTDLVIKDRVQLNEILAMTFTEDAANEMKKRLSKEIADLIIQANDEEKAYLNQQLSLLPDAHISTIHSFCLSIIQNYYYVISLSLKRVNSILDDSSSYFYQRKAMEVVLNKQLELCDEDFYQLNCLLTSNPSDTSDLESLIKKLADLASSQADPSAFLNHCVAQYKINDFNDFSTYFKSLFIEYLTTRITNYKMLLAKLKQRFDEHYPNEEKKYKMLLNKIMLADFTHCSNYQSFRAKLSEVIQSKLSITPNSADTEYKELKTALDGIENELAQLPNMELFISQIHDCRPVVEKLVSCVREYLVEYEKIKQDYDVLDFSDMEHFALKILKQNNSEVAHIYQKRFKTIMVDEFQDSNDVQDTLVQLICQPNNVFRVGDVKQSIYGFRHASPAIMQGYKLIDDENNLCITFNKNYRSTHTLVEFNNLLYLHLMNVEGFNSLPFSQEDHVQVGSDSQKEVNVPVTFHKLDAEKLKRFSDETLKRDELKAKYICNEIVKQVQNGFSFKDFCVLTRGNSKLEVLKKVFQQYNVPIYMNSKSGFYSNPAIQVLIATLKCIHNSEDDIAFVAMLTSVLFNFSTSDLANLALVKQRSESYYQTLTKQNHPQLKTLELLKRKNSAVDCIQIIFKWNHFYDYASSQDKTNLDLFFEKACQYEQDFGSNIAAFLAYLEVNQQQKSAEASSVGKEDDVVRLMSIHASKGLEFKIVYVWGTSKFSKMENRDMMLMDSALGLGCTHIQLPTRLVEPTLIRRVIEYKQNKDNLEEEMRILYVASTRAKEQLHFVDFVQYPFAEDISQRIVDQRRGTTSWILSIFNQMNRNDLFVEKVIDSLWDNYTLSESQSTKVELPAYNETSALVLTTPSNLESQAIDFESLDFSSTARTSYGVLFHKLIELLPLNYSSDLVESLCEKHQLEYSNRLEEDCSALFSNEIFKIALKGTVYKEYPFLVQSEDQVLTGYIDFLSEFDDELIIIDFKSDQGVSEKQLKDRYSSQIVSYIQACRLLFPNKNCSAYMYSLALQSMIEIKAS